VTAYTFVGLVSGAAGLGLALVGLVLAVLGGLRLLLIPGGRRRVGRGLALGGTVLLLCGLALFLAADLLPAPALRRAVDRDVVPLSLAALLLAAAAGLRAGRRRKPPTLPPPPATEGPPPQAVDGSEPPGERRPST